MPPKTPFNGRMLAKIGSFLETKEGCQVLDIDYTYAGAKTTIQDSFGFRYELEIKTIGRTQTDPQEYNQNKNMSLEITQEIK